MQILSFLTTLQLLLSCGVSEKATTQYDSCKSQFDPITKKEVYLFVHEMPKYSDGDAGMIKFITENFKYPEQDQFQATFDLEFVIDVDGTLLGARIQNKSLVELTNAEREAIRVLESMPRWIPGKCTSQKVPVLMFLPLRLWKGLMGNVSKYHLMGIWNKKEGRSFKSG